MPTTPVDMLDMLDIMPSARGRLILTLMPTPLARLLLDFLMPMLLPPDMPTTPDMLPTPLSPPTTITTAMLPTLLMAMASMVPSMDKHNYQIKTLNKAVNIF